MIFLPVGTNVKKGAIVVVNHIVVNISLATRAVLFRHNVYRIGFTTVTL